MNAMERILKSNLCAGCGLCEGSKISSTIKMQLNDDGFSRPTNLSEITEDEAKILEGSCAGVQAEYLLDIKNHSSELGLHYDLMWGQYADIHSGYSTDNSVRHVGSSGGVLTEVARYLLNEKKVDAVVLSTMSRTDPLSVDVVFAENEEDIIRAAGSKYCVSPTLTIVDQIRNYPGTIAFIGKPCDVASLKHYVKKVSSVGSKINIYLSFFCAGVPSKVAGNMLLRRMGVSPDSVSSFWYRGRGWPGNATAITRSDEVFEMPYAEAWGKILSKGLQFRCKICPDGVGELADIVVGDAWECDERGYPLFEEKPGKSLVISRTTKGAEILSAMEINGNIELERLSVRSIDDMQPGQIRRRTALLPRVLAMKLFFRQTPNYPISILLQYSKRLGLSGFLTGFFGMVRRLL